MSSKPFASIPTALTSKTGKFGNSGRCRRDPATIGAEALVEGGLNSPHGRVHVDALPPPACICLLFTGAAKENFVKRATSAPSGLAFVDSRKSLIRGKGRAQWTMRAGGRYNRRRSGERFEGSA